MAHHLIVRPTDLPLTDQGQELRPFLYVVRRGSLRVTRDRDEWDVGYETIIGYEFITLNDAAPPPIARFTVKAVEQSTVECIPRNEIGARCKTNPDTWIRKMGTTMQAMLDTAPLRRRVCHDHVESEADLKTVQQRLSDRERRLHVYVFVAHLLRKLIRPHKARHEHIAQAEDILRRWLDAGKFEEKTPTEHFERFLEDSVVPHLLMARGDPNVEEALYNLSLLMPGIIRSESGIRRAVGAEGDASERPTIPGGPPDSDQPVEANQASTGTPAVKAG